MTWLTFIFALELGFLPKGDLVMYDSWLFDVCPISYSAYTDMEAEVVILDTFFAGGGVRTSIWQLTTDNGDFSFFPHKAVYSFFAGARYRTFEIGFRHFCIHPVVPYFPITWPNPIWEAAYEELYLRISNR